jgi:hypothetical protein
MMNPIENCNDYGVGSRDRDPRITARPRRSAEPVRVGRGFGGRDGRDGGTLLDGAAALRRRAVPAGRGHPAEPGPRRPRPPPSPAPAAAQAPHHHSIAAPPPSSSSGTAPPRPSPSSTNRARRRRQQPLHRFGGLTLASGRVRNGRWRRRGRACTSCRSRRGRVGCGRPSCRPGVGVGWRRRVPRPR